MADVGKMAGVSAMTVSRALKGNSYIAKDTLNRIMAAVEQLGYVLDQSAGSLSSRRSGFIATIMPSIDNSNFADTARGITDTLARTSMQLLLGYTNYSVDREEQLIEAMLRRRPEGIILTGGKHTAKARGMLVNADIPVIETWDVPEDPVNAVVGFSNLAAMEALVCGLIDKGYSKLAFIGGPEEADTRGHQRRLGFERALANRGLDASRKVEIDAVPIRMSHGGGAIRRVLERFPDTDIAICVSDLLAFGAIMECRRMGLAVPDDIAVAGFGDYEIASVSEPGITTVNVDSYGIGTRAAGQMIAMLENRNAATAIKTEYHVLFRDST
ncbi:LacI family DNA-binding transcriptional regulator [Rhizobiales bacterium RZME27]|uniref:LacI family DNA-binding transcriptional regulator n=2 Tax=Endobacterium cereale TaxID=2663029 RepID=A0A6A8A819_9HYPH|nr:LacI family DNA-binding transcriptional regulator [Endobacterium cereale]